MSLPNGGSGGDNHIDRRVPSSKNSSKVSKAMFARDAEKFGNEADWIHEGVIIRPQGAEPEEARQCAACGGYKCTACETTFSNVIGTYLLECPECHGLEIVPYRCSEIAVPNYMTCASHGGGFKPTAAHLAKIKRGAVSNGAAFNQILYCPCNMFKDTCQYKSLYFDEDGEARCFPEKQLYDSIIEYISTSYELDGAADQIVLNRLAMAMLRIKRAEKLVAKDGETVKRTRGSPDGSVETWFEPNSAGAVVDKLDKNLLAWLKSLNVTRQAREAKNATLSGVNDIAALLSGKTSDDHILHLARPAQEDDEDVS